MYRPLMDPLHLCIALGPLAVYLLLLGIINLMPRPFMTSGARDTAALSIAISGFVVAGPMELFLPGSSYRPLFRCFPTIPGVCWWRDFPSGLESTLGAGSYHACTSRS